MNCKTLTKLSYCFISFDLLFAQKDGAFFIQKNKGVLVQKNWENAHKHCEDANGRLVILLDKHGVGILSNLLAYIYGKLANRIIIKIETF